MRDRELKERDRLKSEKERKPRVVKNTDRECPNCGGYTKGGQLCAECRLEAKGKNL